MQNSLGPLGGGQLPTFSTLLNFRLTPISTWAILSPGGSLFPETRVEDDGVSIPLGEGNRIPPGRTLYLVRTMSAMV